jgi:hypothetical protein
VTEPAENPVRIRCIEQFNQRMRLQASGGVRVLRLYRGVMRSNSKYEIDLD